MNESCAEHLWDQILAGKALAEKTNDELLLAAIALLTQAYGRALVAHDKTTSLKPSEVYAWNCITHCRNSYLTLYGTDVINGT
jgi:hypothetical protein